MSLTSKTYGGGGDFKAVPSGTHIACLYLLVDIGWQATNFGDKEQIVLGFELPSCTLDDGRPMIIYRTLTNSMHEKATLRLMIESWRGKQLAPAEAENFDLRAIVGHHCQLSIVHKDSNGTTFSNIKAVTGLPQGLPVPARVNDIVIYDMDEGERLDAVPKWLQEKIAKAKLGPEQPYDEFKGQLDDDILNDDIPF